MDGNRSETDGVVLYHNARCSKSRAALSILRESGVAPEVVDYLKSPLDAAALLDLLSRLAVPAEALLRRGDTLAKDLPLTTDAEIIAAIAAHPKLMQRPVVVTNKGAVIARPPERVLEIL